MMENHHNSRRLLPVAMCQMPEDSNSVTAGVAALLLQEGPYPAKLCCADCMKEDCSHDDLLFVMAFDINNGLGLAEWPFMRRWNLKALVWKTFKRRQAL
ncbi:hypothetical protein AVEN_167632-1 [Araneus ventricosus]|uniref:Uncharacterized protein n=1 Tax=Araneus ventricosus TaxID=182803 RepID=A0A4Y2E969_ARAVE|nr:hypothetical protein AVEN_167632-1 [Araneus ventricosus]